MSGGPRRACEIGLSKELQDVCDKTFPRSRASIRNAMDELIVESWLTHEAAEPDISTERLMDMVRHDTGCDVDRQVAALERVGVIRRVAR